MNKRKEPKPKEPEKFWEIREISEFPTLKQYVPTPAKQILDEFLSKNISKGEIVVKDIELRKKLARAISLTINKDTKGKYKGKVKFVGTQGNSIYLQRLAPITI